MMDHPLVKQGDGPSVDAWISVGRCSGLLPSVAPLRRLGSGLRRSGKPVTGRHHDMSGDEV
jgi:hypothetical protein